MNENVKNCAIPLSCTGGSIGVQAPMQYFEHSLAYQEYF